MREVPTKEQRAFEAWAAGFGYPKFERKNGRYADPNVQKCWSAWRFQQRKKQ